MAFRMLPIARPCAASFEAMSGTASKRFCESCSKHVHDLSAGTEADARALFEKNRGGRICVRVAKDGAGNVVFRGAAMAAAISLAACGSNAADAASPSNVNGAIMTEAPKTTAPNANDVIDYDLGDITPDSVDRCPDEPTPESIADGCPAASSVSDPNDAGK